MKSKSIPKIDVPDLAELAKLYRKASASSNEQLASVSESAALKLAAGEAIMLEAHILFEFASEAAQP